MAVLFSFIGFAFVLVKAMLYMTGSTSMMNNQDILDMCRRLASKYYNHQDYDDIVSEGCSVMFKV